MWFGRSINALRRHLQGDLVSGQVNLLLGLELCDQVVDNDVVKVLSWVRRETQIHRHKGAFNRRYRYLTTQEGVSAGGLHFKDTIANVKDGHIKGSTTQIVDDDRLVFFLVDTKGERWEEDELRSKQVNVCGCVLTFLGSGVHNSLQNNQR